jgi:hypothetical protein
MEKVYVYARLHDNGLPKFLWSEAVRHIDWLKNRMSTKALNGGMSYEVTGKKPNLSQIHGHVWVAESGRTMCPDRRSIAVCEDSHHFYWSGKGRITAEQSATFSSKETYLEPVVA